MKQSNYVENEEWKLLLTIFYFLAAGEASSKKSINA